MRCPVSTRAVTDNARLRSPFAMRVATDGRFAFASRVDPCVAGMSPPLSVQFAMSEQRFAHLGGFSTPHFGNFRRRKMTSFLSFFGAKCCQEHAEDASFFKKTTLWHLLLKNGVFLTTFCCQKVVKKASLFCIFIFRNSGFRNPHSRNLQSSLSEWRVHGRSQIPSSISSVPRFERKKGEIQGGRTTRTPR